MSSLDGFDLVAERGVLGAVLLNNETLVDVVDVVRPADFSPAHGYVFAAMLALSGRQLPIDAVTLADELRAAGSATVADSHVIADAVEDIPVGATVHVRYAGIVRDRALRRALAKAGAAAIAEAREGTGTAEEAVERAQKAILTVSESRGAGDGFVAAREVLPGLFRELEQRFNRDSDLTGVATGLVDFDRATTGLHGGELIIVAGRPAMGKTALAMNIATTVAAGARQPVAVFSLEMGASSLLERALAAGSGVDSHRIRSGRFEPADWGKMSGGLNKLFDSPLFLRDAPGLTVTTARAACRRLQAKHGKLGLVVIDYLQLMRGSGDTDSREQEISEISRGLKLLARELDVPVIALSQLNRSLEKRPDKRPLMSDLRESGAIEQDADLIVFVYRDEVYNPASADKGVAELVIGKQRNGPTTTIPVAFQSQFTRFQNLDQRTADDWRERRSQRRSHDDA